MNIFDKIKQSSWNRPFFKNKKIDRFLNVLFWIVLLFVIPIIIFFFLWVEKAGGLFAR
jgi:uncharacterized BrkB/YihY/UPF0761 family membrane protein